MVTKKSIQLWAKSKILWTVVSFTGFFIAVKLFPSFIKFWTPHIQNKFLLDVASIFTLYLATIFIPLILIIIVLWFLLRR